MPFSSQSRFRAFAAVILLLLTLTAVASLRRQSGITEHFVLRKAYQGPVVVLYAQGNGATSERIGSKLHYHVPASGILEVREPEPVRGSHAVFSFAGEDDKPLRVFSTCRDLNERSRSSATEVCWLDFQAGGTGKPDHVVAVVTTHANLERNFNRTTAVYDSVLTGKKTHALTWLDYNTPYSRSTKPPAK